MGTFDILLTRIRSKKEVYVEHLFVDEIRKPICSLFSYVRMPLQNGSHIDPNLLDPAVRQGYP